MGGQTSAVKSTNYIAVTFATKGQKPVAMAVPEGTTFMQDGKATVVKKTDKPIVFNMDAAHYAEARKLDYNGDGRFNSNDTQSLFKAQKKPNGVYPGEHETKQYTVAPFSYYRDVTPNNQNDNKSVGLFLPGYIQYNQTHPVD